MRRRPTLARAQWTIGLAVMGLLAALSVVAALVGCTAEELARARPAVTAVEGGLVAAGQPVAAGAVEAGFRAWEAGLYLAGLIVAAWGAKKGVKAGVRAAARRRAARAVRAAGGAPRG